MPSNSQPLVCYKMHSQRRFKVTSYSDRILLRYACLALDWAPVMRLLACVFKHISLNIIGYHATYKVASYPNSPFIPITEVRTRFVQV